MSISLATPTSNLTVDESTGEITGLMHGGQQLLDRLNPSRWQRILEGEALFQADAPPVVSQPRSTTILAVADGICEVEIESEFLNLSNVFRYKSRTILTAPSSGSNSTVSLSKGQTLTGRATTIAPHFGIASPVMRLDADYQGQKYSLDIGEELSDSHAANEFATDRPISGGPVSVSADGLLGIGIYSFGPRVTLFSKSTRWYESGEMARLEEWENGYQAYSGVHHQTSYLVSGNAQEIYDTFVDLHNHHLADRERRKKNAVRLDAPIS